MKNIRQTKANILRDSWVEINIENLAHNAKEFRKHVPSDTKLLAVVKADAYGHGSVMLAPTLLASGFDMLGVASIDEGVDLRNAKINCDILVLGAVPVWAVESAVQADLSIAIFSKEHLTACKNAFEEAQRVTGREERVSAILAQLGKMLAIEPPGRIESYDISNQGADDIVASMVVYVNAKPLKRDYRHFKLKDMDGPDDYASMDQVLRRRFQRYLDGDEKFADKPDLLLIDGGENHARVAVGVLNDLALTIPVFGMVKDDRHRTRALVTPEGQEIGIQGNQAIFSLIGQIQEETHRFAIEFHRQQQNQRVKGSVLDQIPGVGEKRRADLLKHFKSVKKIREATQAQLAEVVPKNTAQAVYDYFHQQGEEST